MDWRSRWWVIGCGVIRFPDCEVAGCSAPALAQQPTCREHCENWDRFVASAHRLLTGSQELEGLNFTGITLEDVDLGGRLLRGCCFDHATLRRVRLADASLLQVSLAYATVTELDAPRLTMTACVWARSELSTLELGGSDLLRSNFVAIRASDVNFDGSDLSGSRFSWARFERVSLRDCNLQQVHFVGTEHLTATCMDESNVLDATLE